NPQPSTLNPRPSTLNPRPSTLNPQLSTLNPQPSTLNPRPSTLNPSVPVHCTPSGASVSRNCSGLVVWEVGSGRWEVGLLRGAVCAWRLCTDPRVAILGPFSDSEGLNGSGNFWLDCGFVQSSAHKLDTTRTDF
ncbi:hypothetical protein T484DRAFT_1632019, partial [Baffinella frigidus]